MKNIGFLLLFFLTSFLAKAENEQLIVFYQADTDQHFIENCLPQIRTFAKEKGIELLEKGVKEGLPDRITSTPAVLYQNYRGRSVFAARYMEFSSIKNFIRTSKFVPQKEATICKEEVLTMKDGRTQVIAPIKLTNLQGSVPTSMSMDQFNNKAKAAVARGMNDFTVEAQTCLRKTDRAFYIDMHPYVDQAGKLFLTLEMYSQFSCIDPVYKTMTPVTGKITSYEQMFEQAGKTFAAEIQQKLSASTIGDAISSVSADIPSKDWTQLGLDLPAKPKLAKANLDINFDLAGNWKYAGPLDPEVPALQFRFMEPLERYAGEVPNIEGHIAISKEDKITGGKFVVETQSMTMGMESLDKKVLEKYIKAYKYPKSSFTFDEINQETALVFGETNTINIKGTFQLMKYKKPLSVNAQITPILSEDGKPMLSIQTAFSINITDDYGIDGPDGPSPANKTLVFNINLLMNADSASTSTSSR